MGGTYGQEVGAFVTATGAVRGRGVAFREHPVMPMAAGTASAQRTPQHQRNSRNCLLYLTESPDGFRLTPYHPEFERQMIEARRIMKKRRDALRELAK